MFDKMVKKIKRTLGYPIVPVELSDADILEIITDCMEDLYEYSSDYEVITVPTSKVIDLSALAGLAKVKDVVQADGSIVDSDEGIASVILGMQGGVYTQDYHNLVQSRMILKAQQRLVSSTTKSLSWRVVGTKLYVDSPDEVTSVTITYVKTWDDESKMDRYWNQMLTRYAGARVNEVIGRARNKYKSSEGLYEVDSSMLDTALEDINKIFEELRTNDVLFPSEL